MKLKIRLLPVIILLCSLTSFSQKVELINSAEIIEKGIKLHDAGKFVEAIEQYKLISRNDTNYVYALTEMAMSQVANKAYEDAIETCKIGLSYKSEHKYHLYNSFGTAYDELGKTEEATKVYNEAIEMFPYNHLLYFNLGIVQRRKDLPEQAIKSFQEAIYCNYYYSSSHYHLGLTLYTQGRIVPAMMSLSMFLMLESSTKRSEYAIEILEAICDGSFEENSEVLKTTNEEDKIFEEVEMIIRSKIALDKNYKSEIKIYDPFIKQFQVMCEKLEYIENNDNFWMRNYVSFFSNIYKEKKIEPATFLILTSVKHKKIQKWHSKNKTKQKSFIDWAVKKISKTTKNGKIVWQGKEQIVSHWYSNNNNLQAIGNEKQIDNKTAVDVGYWLYIQSVGNIKSNGYYNEKGERTGEWKWYNDENNVIEIRNYENGKSHGKLYNFYPNGVLNLEITYNNGMMNGERLKYYNTGQLKVQSSVAANEYNGKSKYFYEYGNLQYDVNYKNSKTDSIFLEYYSNGNISRQVSYYEDIANGEAKFFYENGAIQSEGEYKNDEKNGEWKFYHENKQLQQVVNYNEKGEIEGSIKSYDKNGKPDFVNNYKNGKLNGDIKYYDEDGIIYFSCNPL